MSIKTKKILANGLFVALITAVVGVVCCGLATASVHINWSEAGWWIAGSSFVVGLIVILGDFSDSNRY